MKFRKLVAGAAALAAASSLAFAGQAQANPTPLEFTLNNGLLSISAPATTVVLDPQIASLPQFTGAVPTTVTDERNALTGWSVNAQVDDFVNGAAGTVAATNVVMVIDPLSIVDDVAEGQVFTPAAPVTDGSGTVGTLAVDLGILDPILGSNNTVTYDLGVTVNIPAGTPNGTYTSTLTQTVI